MESVTAESPKPAKDNPTIPFKKAIHGPNIQSAIPILISHFT